MISTKKLVELNTKLATLLVTSMIPKPTEYYNLYFYDTYVIAEAKENSVIDSAITEKVLDEIEEHYNGRLFTLISHRKNKYSISEDAYSPRKFRKVKGMAIVSTDPEVKEKAIQEQLNFQNSFAYFDKLEDAVSWAQSFRGVEEAGVIQGQK